MIVGIDLGTTNSLVGAMEAGLPVLFAGDDGSRLTPSVVAYPDGSPNAGPLVGGAALGSGLPCVRSIKRLMGARVGGAGDFPGVIGTPGEPARVTAGGEARTPEEISAAILAKLKCDAERALGAPVSRAVITVPAYFNDAQRAATKRAGELAGFTVERLLPEPTAAALSFGYGGDGRRARIAVFDLGGGTFDISILDLEAGVFNVLATNGDTRLGGDDLDRAIAREFGCTEDEARAMKCAPPDGSESRIRGAIAPVLARIRPHCECSLRDAGLSASDLDEVILVGGATRMPAVRELAEEIFGRAPNVSPHPDEAVALGAAIQAGILSGSVENVTLLDVTPLSLGIETYGGLMNVIIPRNTTIPAKAGEMFTNAADGQTEMRITVLQGERELAADNWRLGEFTVSFPPAPRGQARVGVQFEIDANGILHVLARDIATGRDSVLELSSAVDVSDEAIEKMLADSIEHAFEDMDERAFAEAKLKADEMLSAIESARPHANESELAAIGDAAEAVRAAIGDHSVRRLKAALAALDEATAPLAARILEDALQST